MPRFHSFWARGWGYSLRQWQRWLSQLSFPSLPLLETWREKPSVWVYFIGRGPPGGRLSPATRENKLLAAFTSVPRGSHVSLSKLPPALSCISMAGGWEGIDNKLGDLQISGARTRHDDQRWAQGPLQRAEHCEGILTPDNAAGPRWRPLRQLLLRRWALSTMRSATPSATPKTAPQVRSEALNDAPVPLGRLPVVGRGAPS